MYLAGKVVGSEYLSKYINDIDRTLKSYAHKRETTISSYGSLQLWPFPNGKKNLRPEGENYFL